MTKGKFSMSIVPNADCSYPLSIKYFKYLSLILPCSKIVPFFAVPPIENFFLNNLVNFHGTRLPLDSGGGGFSWKIMREDRIDNQLVHVVDEGIDSGPIIDNHLSLFPKQCQIPKDYEIFRLKKFIQFYSKFIKKVKEEKKFECHVFTSDTA